MLLSFIVFTTFSQTKKTNVFNVYFGAYSLDEYKELDSDTYNYIFRMKSMAYSQIEEYFSPFNTSSLSEFITEMNKWKNFINKNEINVLQDFGDYSFIIIEKMGKKGIKISMNNRNDQYSEIGIKQIDKILKEVDSYTK